MKKKMIEKYCISPESSLLECMNVIDNSAAGIALAINEDFTLIGTISDGDIRRALINGFSLKSAISPHINRKCFTVSPTVSRSDVLDVMQARRFEQVPIVDAKKKVLGLHVLHDIIGNYDRPNWAVIMAGGRGSRLRPLTDQIPKPMLQVAGRPILERIILHFRSYGIKKIFLAVNYLSHMIEDHFEDGARYGCTIEYLREDEPLGSGGALSLLPEKSKHPILVMNGDLIVNIDFAELIDFHTKNDLYATMGVHNYTHEVPFGCAEIENGRLIRLAEKPILQKTINAGIYILSPKAVASIPKNSFFPITHLFDDAIKNSFDCGAYVIKNEWLDVGRPQQLKQARGDI